MKPHQTLRFILTHCRHQVLLSIDVERRLSESSKVEDIKINEETKKEALKRLKKENKKLALVDAAIETYLGVQSK